MEPNPFTGGDQWHQSAGPTSPIPYVRGTLVGQLEAKLVAQVLEQLLGICEAAAEQAPQGARQAQSPSLGPTMDGTRVLHLGHVRLLAVEAATR